MNSSNNSTDIEIIYYCLNDLCKHLDFLSDPNIETKMICELEFYPVDILMHRLEIMLEEKTETPLYENVIDTTGIEMLRQFANKFYCILIWHQPIYIRTHEKGFSQTPEWQEFSLFAGRLSTRIKDSVKKHKAIG